MWSPSYTECEAVTVWGSFSPTSPNTRALAGEPLCSPHRFPGPLFSEVPRLYLLPNLSSRSFASPTGGLSPRYLSPLRLLSARIRGYSSMGGLTMVLLFSRRKNICEFMVRSSIFGTSRELSGSVTNPVSLPFPTSPCPG